MNLAVHLLNDCWLDRYKCAIVVRNDSDLAEAMHLVKQHRGKKMISLVKPYPEQDADELSAPARFVRPIRPGALQNAQLPDLIPGTNFRKPAGW